MLFGLLPEFPFAQSFVSEPVSRISYPVIWHLNFPFLTNLTN